MTTVQKLRKYISGEMAAGRLKPGDSLPGLRDKPPWPARLVFHLGLCWALACAGFAPPKLHWLFSRAYVRITAESLQNEQDDKGGSP